MSTARGAASGSDAAPKPTRGRPARHTRQRLLELVVGVFNERGYEATSMEDLARVSGLTKSTFYHHVSGKEELLRMAATRALDALSAALDESAEHAARPVDRLALAIRRTAETLLAELPYVTVLLRVRGNTAVERDAVARRRAIDARLAALVTAAADAGEIRADIDPRLVSRLLFGMVNSITEWYRPDRPDGARQDIVDAVAGLALHGLARSVRPPRAAR